MKINLKTKPEKGYDSIWNSVSFAIQTFRIIKQTNDRIWKHCEAEAGDHD